LDEVEERESAVAVLLRDGDDESQVPARELALRLLVLREAVLDLPRAPDEVVERLEGLHLDLGEALFRLLDLLGAAAAPVEVLDALPKGRDLLGELHHVVLNGPQSLRLKGHLLEEVHRLHLPAADA